jgi:hypothetical protein
VNQRERASLAVQFGPSRPDETHRLEERLDVALVRADPADNLVPRRRDRQFERRKYLVPDL